MDRASYALHYQRRASDAATRTHDAAAAKQVCSTPPGVGAAGISATVAGLAASLTAAFTFDGPALSALAPGNAAALGAGRVTVLGQSLG